MGVISEIKTLIEGAIKQQKINVDKDTFLNEFLNLSQKYILENNLTEKFNNSAIDILFYICTLERDKIENKEENKNKDDVFREIQVFCFTTSLFDKLYNDLLLNFYSTFNTLNKEYIDDAIHYSIDIILNIIKENKLKIGLIKIDEKEKKSNEITSIVYSLMYKITKNELINNYRVLKNRRSLDANFNKKNYDYDEDESGIYNDYENDYELENEGDEDDYEYIRKTNNQNKFFEDEENFLTEETNNDSYYSNEFIEGEKEIEENNIDEINESEINQYIETDFFYDLKIKELKQIVNNYYDIKKFYKQLKRNRNLFYFPVRIERYKFNVNKILDIDDFSKDLDKTRDFSYRILI